ncbi:hypothetical protein DL771_012470 [Monosporascus sp. 5C6A]|nr:hypothetical protein DL771_012470 [Monosporascus sp. 5C6A]
MEFAGTRALRPAGSYRAPRAVMSEGQLSEDELMSESEGEFPRNARRGRQRKITAPAAPQGVGTRMKGRLRERQSGRSRSQIRDDFDLYSHPRAPGGYGYPAYPGPVPPGYEGAGQTFPYNDVENPFASRAPRHPHPHPHPPPASYPQHASYPPHGGYPLYPPNPFVPYDGTAAGPRPEVPLGPPPGPRPKPPRLHPRDDTEMNRIRHEIKSLKVDHAPQREGPFGYEGEREGRRAEEHRRVKSLEAQRQEKARRRELEQLRREIERQVYGTLEGDSRRPIDGTRSQVPMSRELELALRHLVAENRNRDYAPAGQPSRADVIDRLIDLMQNQRRTDNGSSTMTRGLDDQTRSLDGSQILRRLDDMMSHQRQLEEAVGELLYQLRDDAPPGRRAVPTGPPPMETRRLPEIDYDPRAAPSAWPQRSDELQSTRHSSRRMPRNGDMQNPLPPEVEEVLSRQSTEATLQALRNRSRPGSPVGDDEYRESQPRNSRRKGVKVERMGGLRQRGSRQLAVEDSDDDSSDDSGDGYELVRQHHKRRPTRGRAGPSDGSTEDTIEVDLSSRRLRMRPSGEGLRSARSRSRVDVRSRSRANARSRSRVDARSRSRPRPVEIRGPRRAAAARPVAYSDPDDSTDADAHDSSEDESYSNPFSPPPSAYQETPTRSAASRMYTENMRARLRPRAPTPPPVT